MSANLNPEVFSKMLRSAAAIIAREKDHLCKLDSCGGDGDHGITICRAMDRAVQAAEAADPSSLAEYFNDIAWAIMGVDGGATGPLFGSLFLGLSEAVEGVDALDSRTLAGAFAQGLEKVRKNTRAQVGDKTLLDALVPAVEALAVSAEQGLQPADALNHAARAAREGAESTKAFPARFGRAKHVAEKSLGTEDPGAVSVSLLFLGFAEGVGQGG